MGKTREVFDLNLFSVMKLSVSIFYLNVPKLDPSVALSQPFGGVGLGVLPADLIEEVHIARFRLQGVVDLLHSELRTADENHEAAFVKSHSRKSPVQGTQAIRGRGTARMPRRQIPTILSRPSRSKRWWSRIPAI